jgi:hypothetical protein
LPALTGGLKADTTIRKSAVRPWLWFFIRIRYMAER